ncbi:MAG: PAS domain-containing protein [Lentisphaerota bacterium]
MSTTGKNRGKAVLWRVALAAGLIIEILFIATAVLSMIRGHYSIPAWQQLAFVAILVWIYIAYLKQRAMDISSFVVDEKIKAHSLVENLEEGIILVDPSHQILLLNGKASQLTGLSDLEVLGKNLLEETDAATRAMLESNRAGESECSFVKTGRKVRLGVKLLRTHDTDEPHKLIRVYEAAAAVRTPPPSPGALATQGAIRCLQQLVDAPADGLEESALCMLKAQCALLLLKAGEREAGQGKKERTPLGSLLARVLEPVRKPASILKLALDGGSIPPETTVLADPAGLETALGLILRHALLKCPRPGRITVKTAPMGDNVGMAFRINDIVLAPAALAALFDAPAAEGSDGLALARGIVEACGGSMWADSPTGGGLNITLMLPIHQA